MSRAPRRPPQERRAEIAAAARELALAEGLSAVTLRGVAARAGVTPALVAHYHPSMDALVAEAFAAVVSAELGELRGLVAGAEGAGGGAAGAGPAAGDAGRGDAARRLSALLHAVLDGTRDDVTLVWVEAWALGRRNDTLAAAVREQMDAWQALLRDLVAAGVADGDFDTADADAAAWQLLGMIDGLNAQALVRWGATADRGPVLARAVEGMLGARAGALT